MFAENQYGGLNRSITGGSDMGSMWDNRIAASFKTPGTNANANITSYFDNPLTLWEDPTVTDRIKRTGAIEGDDTLVNSRLFFAMDNGIWMCTDANGKAFDPGKPKGRGSIRWFRVSDKRGIHFHDHFKRWQLTLCHYFRRKNIQNRQSNFCQIRH